MFKTKRKGTAFVFDFDNTLTGPRITKRFPKSYHTWKVIHWNSHEYTYCANIDFWDDHSKTLIKNLGNFRVHHVTLLEKAYDFCAYFFDGTEGVKTLEKQLHKLNELGPIYISSNGDAQVIYYILKCVKLLKYFTGIHSMDFLTRSKGHYINIAKTSNPFTDFIIVPTNKKQFMEKYLLPKHKKIIYADDDAENLYSIADNSKIVPFIAADFNKENCCLLDHHYRKIRRMFKIY